MVPPPSLAPPSSPTGEVSRLEANDLALFARIAEAGSFSRAAEQLHQPRSTVSRRLAELENALGERLLVRSTRKLRLTEFGRAMLAHAGHVVEALAAATALAENRQVEPSGRLRVTVPSYLAQTFAAQMFDRFMSDYPRVTLDLELSSRRVDLLTEDCDLLIRLGELEQQDASLTTTRLADLPIGLYAAPAYLDRVQAPRRPQDLEHKHGLIITRQDGPQPWELARRVTNGGPVERWVGLPPAKCFATSGEFLLGMALSGHGIAGLPDSMARANVEAGRLVPVLPEWRLPNLPIWAVFSGRQLLPTKTRAFLDAMRAFFGH